MCKDLFGYTIPTFQPIYTYIPLVSPLKKSDNMDGFNLGDDNQIKSIDIKNGKLVFEVCDGIETLFTRHSKCSLLLRSVPLSGREDSLAIITLHLRCLTERSF